MKLLVVTLPGDIHAHAIAWAFRQRSHEVDFLYPLDVIKGSEWTFRSPGSVLSVRQGGAQLELHASSHDALWIRRVPQVFPLVHIQDLQERSACESELEHHIHGALSALERSCFAVNPLSASFEASRKSLQLAIAADVGLRTPDTLVTNSRQDIESFFVSHNERIIYKPLVPFLWTREDQSKTYAPTTLLADLSIMSDADVCASPAIYQEVIVKDFEVRAIMMGRTVMAWKSTPRDIEVKDSAVDWRVIGLSKFDCAKYTLPAEVEEQCFALMDRLGLLFGCIDIGVTAEGHHIFFEVNPGGQFLYGDERGTGLNILEGFVQFLESRDRQFSYQEPAFPIKYADFRSEVDYSNALEVEMSQHEGYLPRWHHSQVSVEF